MLWLGSKYFGDKFGGMGWREPVLQEQAELLILETGEQQW
jgi:hypothetical protein